MELYRAKCSGRSPFNVVLRTHGPDKAGGIGFIDGNLAFNIKTGAGRSDLGTVI